jgi:hypothetical protein
MNKLYAMLFATLVAAPVIAGPVGIIKGIGESEKAELVLHDTPCVNERALERVKTDARPFWKHGEYTDSTGKKIVACWAFNQGSIVISDEEGDVGVLPAQLVKKIQNT